MIAAHTGADLGVGGKTAVELFFLISGYLISFILKGENSYKSVKAFYINRALRIYPIYFLVAFAALGANLVADFIGTSQVFERFQSLGLGGQSLLVFSNIFIFFQDSTLFLDEHSGHLFFWEIFPRQLQICTRACWYHLLGACLWN